MEVNHINNDSQSKAKYNSPIPSPSHPKQYRAIGLIYGKYQPSPEKLTRGVILTEEGPIIDAVLLGRIIAFIKNHLDLNKEHLWVVYPHLKQENNQFHAQIVGVWQAENSNQNSEESLNLKEEFPLKHGYFSVRGEVIFYSKEEAKVIVRIIQSPRKKSTQANFLKLQLTGILPHNSLGHFFDFDVFLKDNNLVIEKAHDLGLLLKNHKVKKRKY